MCPWRWASPACGWGTGAGRGKTPLRGCLRTNPYAVWWTLQAWRAVPGGSLHGSSIVGFAWAVCSRKPPTTDACSGTASAWCAAAVCQWPPVCGVRSMQGAAPLSVAVYECLRALLLVCVKAVQFRPSPGSACCYFGDVLCISFSDVSCGAAAARACALCFAHACCSLVWHPCGSVLAPGAAPAWPPCRRLWHVL